MLLSRSPRSNMTHWFTLCCAIVAWGLAQVASSGVWADEFSPEDIEFFEKRVRPVLAARCFECHGAKSEKLRGGLRLDSREAILRGGDTGSAAVAGDVEKSLLVEAIGFKSSQIEMPPAGRLPDKEIADLTEWVRRGLPFPAATATAVARSGIDLEAGRRHWAFQPLAHVDLAPRLAAARAEQVAGAARQIPVDPPRTRVDPFLAAARQQQQLVAAAPAPPRTLLRRSQFALTGLPPTVEQIAEFLEDTGPDAYDRWVDRQLASPHFGERWGRHWLDLARYCDIPEQWREGEAKAYHYRDWVVRAYNDDISYADFVRRQLAADLQPNNRPADNAALGFLGLSPTYWKELKLDHVVIKQVVADEWEEQIEAIGGTFLGLTLACARCHDHKFDPVSSQDYYALAGVLASVRQDDTPLIPAPLAAAARAARQQVAALEKQIETLSANKPIDDERQREIDDKRFDIERLRRDTAYFELPPAFGIVEASLHVLPDGPHRTKIEYRPGQPQDIALQVRGNPAKPGPVVPRRFLSVLTPNPDARFDHGSGRAQLAEALVTDAAPLTTRVYVNRVWRQVFGRGLVTSTSNFGTQGERPTHPELLDDLASRFLAHDGSTKWLVRELITSAAFRQSSARDEQSQRDPENVWLARMPVRRLDVEAWRDAMLVSAGQLQDQLGGPPRDLLEERNSRRTLYGTVKRRELNDLLRLYDFPDPVAHSAARDQTTTPLQQLFVLNSPFFEQQAIAIAQRVVGDNATQPAEQIRAAYLRLFGREPTAAQLNWGAEFLATLQRDGLTLAAAWNQYAQVLLSSNEFTFVD